MMKPAVVVRLVLVVVAFAAGALAKGSLAAAPQDPAGGFAYLHIFGMVNDCHALVSGSTMRGAPTPGVSLLDLRNGNMWCLPKDGAEPIFLSQVDLPGIPAQAPKGPKL
jgi:hypothetical protein